MDAVDCDLSSKYDFQMKQKQNNISVICCLDPQSCEKSCIYALCIRICKRTQPVDLSEE